MAGTLFVVATPIGNLEDISARALRVLRDVAVIASEDTRRTARLLARYAISTRTTSLHEHNEAAKSGGLIVRLAAGESIALVSDAGTPLISDPGQRLIANAAAAGIRIEPVPGPSAVMAVLSAAGFSAESFTFLGFAPTKKSPRSAWISELLTSRRTAVFFEAPHRIRRTLGEIATYLGERQIVLGRELTKVHETILRGSAHEVLLQLGEPKGEFVVAIAGIELGQSREYGGLDQSNAAFSPAEASGEGDAVNENRPEIGLTTENVSSSRRRAIAALASELGLSANRIYKALEDAKRSGD